MAASSHSKRAEERAHDVLVVVLCLYIVSYATLTATGSLFFVYKSAVVPAFVIYALFSRKPQDVAVDWLPFLAATVLFDALRGAIYVAVEAGYRPVLVHYPVVLENWLFGTQAASLPLQAAFRTATLDRLLVVVHGSHFLFFLLFGLALWHARPSEFWRYRRTFLGVMAGGLFCYLAAPTAPPFIAAETISAMAPVVRIVAETYTRYVPELYGAFDTNPVAAMPSLHAAFPFACWLVARQVWGGVASALAGGYAGIVCFAAIYLGEHYAVDVIGGLLLAAAAFYISNLRPPTGPPQSLRGAVVQSGIIVVAAMLIGAQNSP